MATAERTCERPLVRCKAGQNVATYYAKSANGDVAVVGLERLVCKLQTACVELKGGFVIAAGVAEVREVRPDLPCRLQTENIRMAVGR
jgi:hypothetical protein